ncbi:MAG: hypothetical protein KGL39_11245 [Patescibacteria group bacterium]|nr:hypothetical protein [Patescibacteria group bacterium]
MPSIYSYQKIIDAVTTHLLALPEDATTHQKVGTELCTIGGVTYVSIPDGYTLPAIQPSGITPTQLTLPIADPLYTEIFQASPHVQLINKQVRDMIAEKYQPSDEIRALRLGSADPGWAPYNTYVESCRAWGKNQKALLGL